MTSVTAIWFKILMRSSLSRLLSFAILLFQFSFPYDFSLHSFLFNISLAIPLFYQSFHLKWKLFHILFHCQLILLKRAYSNFIHLKPIPPISFQLPKATHSKLNNQSHFFLLYFGSRKWLSAIWTLSALWKYKLFTKFPI